MTLWLSYICDYGVEYMSDSIRLSVRDPNWFSICVALVEYAWLYVIEYE